MPDGLSGGGGAPVAAAPAMQRVAGRAAVALARRGGATRLAGLEQAGSARAFLPRVDGPVPEIVFLNTAGGLTGGDRLAYSVALGDGAAAVAMTQTAERAYAAAGGVARLEVALALGQGAALDWLPQETILFDRSALERRTEVDMAGDARLLMVETLVMGRAAMGETLREVALSDIRRLRRGGRLALLEPLRLSPAALAAGPAGLDGARAVASLWLFAPGAEAAAEALRAALPALPGLRAAVSGWDGRLALRIMAVDALPLRQALAAALAQLRGRALPRVWQI